MAVATELESLQRENAYLKLRVAQLQGDVTDLSSEVDRLRGQLDRIGVRMANRPDPLGGGQ